MAEPILLGRLQDRYARKLGELRAHERAAREAFAELRTLEDAIRLYEPGWSGADVRPIKPHRRSRWGRQGKGMRTALEVLRDADAPLTMREIVVQVHERLGMPVPPYDELRKVMASFNGALARKIGKGIVCFDGWPKRWAVER